MKGRGVRIALVIVLAAVFGPENSFAGNKYLGVSQLNLEGGFSSEKWNAGLGARGFIYNANRPSHLGSSGDLDFTVFYIQRQYKQIKIQLGHEYQAHFLFYNGDDDFESWSSLGIVKFGLEARLNEILGAYWDCLPVYVANFNLFESGNWDLNRIEVGLLRPKIGIRAYF